MLAQLLASTFRVSTPLIFAALGGMFSERAGVVNVALEGLMLVGAFGAAAGTLWTHSPWLGAGCGIAAGALLAAVYAFFVVRLRANQIISGMAINLLALGLTPFLCKVLYDATGSTPAIPFEQRLQISPVYLSWACVLACWVIMNRTRPGLWLAFAGEHPGALASAGIDVNRTRWSAVIISGMLAGMGGATLSIFLSSAFARNMTAGRGFMALAALVFGKWKPVPAAMACVLFGFAEAVQIRLQGLTLWGEHSVPLQFVQVLPYALTIAVLAGFVGKSKAPKALGKPWTAE